MTADEARKLSGAALDAETESIPEVIKNVMVQVNAAASRGNRSAYCSLAPINDALRNAAVRHLELLGYTVTVESDLRDSLALLKLSW